MNIIKCLAKKLVIPIINTALTIFIFYWNIMAIINGIKTPDADWTQIFMFLVCSVGILLVMWFLTFLKFIRNFIIVVLILLLIGWLSLPKMFPNVTDGLCVTMGSCKEGVEVKTVSGKVIINQQNCLKQGWKWNAKKNVCETRLKKEDK